MTPQDFAVRFERVDAMVLVRVSGEVDLATAPKLCAVLEDVIVDQGNLSVTVDLGEVTFMDSSGLNALVSALKHLPDRNGHLMLARPSAMTMRLFELTGLDTVYDVIANDHSTAATDPGQGVVDIRSSNAAYPAVGHHAR